jgi:hypothetical protein
LVEEAKEKTPLGRNRYRREDIKIVLKEIWWDDVC